MIPACTWALSWGGTQKQRATGRRPNDSGPLEPTSEQCGSPFHGQTLFLSGSLGAVSQGEHAGACWQRQGSSFWGHTAQCAGLLQNHYLGD
jgi:hypothetical protein